MEKLKLSVNTIVKNAESTIEACLKSVCDIADEVIIIDTGSTDDTIKIIEKFPVKLFQIEWTEDFSNARNYALNQSTGDWILYIDADEVLKSDRPTLMTLMKGAAEGYWFIVESYVTPDLTQSKIHRNLRMFRKRPHYRFEGNIHEQILRSMMNSISIDQIKESGLKIEHFGYLPEHVKNHQKVERNIHLLEQALKEEPNQPFHLYNLGVEYSRKNNYGQSSVYLKKCLELEQPGASYLPSVYYLLATNEMNSLRLLEAETFLKQAIELFPRYTDLYFLLGKIYRDQGQLKIALEMLYKAVELGDAPEKYISTKGAGSFLAHYEIGLIYQTLGSKKEALQRFMLVISSVPDFFPAYSAALWLLFETGAERRIVHKQVSEIGNISGVNKLLLGKALCTIGEYEIASLYLNQIQPVGNSAMTVKNECLMYTGKCQEAILIQKKMLHDMPIGHQDEKEWLTDHIISFWKVQAPVPIIIRQRLRKNPTHEWLEWIVLHFEDHKPILEELTGEFNNLFKKILNYGFIDLAEKIHKMVKGCSNQLFARYLYEGGYISRAAEQLLEIMKHEKLDAESAFCLGEILFDRNQFERAAMMFEQALSDDPSFWRARTGAALSYLAEGFQWLEESREHLPKSELLAQQLEEIKESITELQKIDWHTRWTPQQRRHKNI